jgi:putative ABC transport system permease protein
MIHRWTDQILNADVIVSTSALLRSTSYHFSEDLAKRISTLPEVRIVENVRFTVVPFRGDGVAITAVSMKDFLMRSYGAIQGASKQQIYGLLPQGKGILVSRNLAARWKYKVGNVVHLDTPTGALELPIVGIVDDYRSDKGTIFMERAVYKQYWKDDAVDFVDISLKPGQDPVAVKHKIEQMTAGEEHALVYTNAEFRDWIGSLVDAFFVMNYMQLVVAVFVAVMGIANTLVISVAERKREFGIVRAIGGYKTQVKKMVLLEALAISVVGVMVAAVAALFNIQFMSHTVSTVLAGYEVPFYFPWLLILETLPAVVAISLLAGWAPARHAMQAPVIEAIGYE